jgi:restriction endonuclease S subunit
LEGLETVELKLSEVLEDNKENRLDPEYFNKTAQIAYLRLKHHRRFGDLVKNGYRVIYENTHAIDRTEGIAAGLPFFLQAADIQTPFISGEGMICVSQDDWERYPKGRVIPGEVLIEVKGKAEKVAIVPDDFPKNSLITGTVYKMTVHDELDKYLLVSYLTSRHGQALKDRLKTNLLISFISKSDLFNLPIPDFNIPLKIAIKRNFLSAESKHKKSKSLLQQAEQTLLHALGLEGWQPPEPLTYTRRASDAFAAGRLDADYFEPKYEALIAKMETAGSCVPLDSLLELNRRGKQPEYAEYGLPVINSKHVLKNEVRLNTGNAFAVTSDDALKIKTGDVVINGTGVGTIGRAAAYLHKESALPDNHVTILRPRAGAIDPVYLAVYLNTIAGQWQVEKYLRGSSGQIELYPVDIAQFQICLTPDSIQKEIHNMVIRAFSARRQAHALLDAAKRAVEIAIEHNEQAALEYLAAIGETT